MNVPTNTPVMRPTPVPKLALPSFSKDELDKYFASVTILPPPALLRMEEIKPVAPENLTNPTPDTPAQLDASPVGLQAEEENDHKDF